MGGKKRLEKLGLVIAEIWMILVIAVVVSLPLQILGEVISNHFNLDW